MTEKKYMNPYRAGFLLGLVLLAAIFISGRGLGASGAVKSAVVAGVDAVAPLHAQNTPFYSSYLSSHNILPMMNWLVFEVLGMIIGGFLSGLISGRLGFKTEHGPGITSRKRKWIAVIGGFLFAFGAQFGRGCTSGVALTGMAVMSLGGIITMMFLFGTGYGLAYFFRKLWI